MKNEDEFERQLFKFAPVEGCYYYKIPDTKMINKHNRKSHRELKRPFDGVLVTPIGNFCIECKYGYGKLSEHQKNIRDKVNNINGTHYVFRKKINVRENIVLYSVEKRSQSNEVKLLSANILDLFKFFANIPVCWEIEGGKYPLRADTYKHARMLYHNQNVTNSKGKFCIVKKKLVEKNYGGPFEW